jgi:lysophospholipid acyltransferase 5
MVLTMSYVSQGYLVVGYYLEQVSGKEYNISWTMPQCVLTLRLTAVAFDLYDGAKVSDHCNCV